MSVTNFLQIDRVDTSQQNISAKFDVLIFPFLDVYGLARIHEGHDQGSDPGSRRSHPGHHRAQATSAQCRVQWPNLRRGFNPPGGTKVSDWRDLTAIAVADWNRTKTNLSFENETLIAETKPVATVFSARLGLHGTVGTSKGAAIWIGAMHQASSRRSREALPIPTFNSSWSNRRPNHGTRCSAA